MSKPVKKEKLNAKLTKSIKKNNEQKVRTSSFSTKSSQQEEAAVVANRNKKSLKDKYKFLADSVDEETEALQRTSSLLHAMQNEKTWDRVVEIYRRQDSFHDSSKTMSQTSDELLSDAKMQFYAQQVNFFKSGQQRSFSRDFDTEADSSLLRNQLGSAEESYVKRTSSKRSNATFTYTRDESSSGQRYPGGFEQENDSRDHIARSQSRARREQCSASASSCTADAPCCSKACAKLRERVAFLENELRHVHFMNYKLRAIVFKNTKASQELLNEMNEVDSQAYLASSSSAYELRQPKPLISKRFCFSLCHVRHLPAVAAQHVQEMCHYSGKIQCSWDKRRLLHKATQWDAALVYRLCTIVHVTLPKPQRAELLASRRASMRVSYAVKGCHKAVQTTALVPSVNDSTDMDESLNDQISLLGPCAACNYSGLSSSSSVELGANATLSPRLFFKEHKNAEKEMLSNLIIEEAERAGLLSTDSEPEDEDLHDILCKDSAKSHRIRDQFNVILDWLRLQCDFDIPSFTYCLCTFPDYLKMLSEASNGPPILRRTISIRRLIEIYNRFINFELNH